MIVMFSEQGKSFDFITLTSLKFAMNRISGPIVPWSPGLDFKDAKQLAIIGHGAPGAIAGVKAEDIAARIGHDKFGVPKDIERILITSCNAGLPKQDQLGTSVVEIIAGALCKRGVERVVISGAKGPSVKADVLGEDFRVIDPKAVNARGKGAGAIQGELEAKHQLVKPGDLGTPLNPEKHAFLQRDPTGSATVIKGKYYEAPSPQPGDSHFESRMTIAAAAAEMGTRRFYREFGEILQTDSLTVNSPSMLTIKVVNGRMTYI